MENRWIGALGLVLLAQVACSNKADDAAQQAGTRVASAAGTGAAQSPQAAANGAAGAGGRTSPVLTTVQAGASGATTSSGDDAGADCGRQRFDVRRKPADILLVLDRSGSMKEEPDGAGDDSPSKWELVLPALKEAISTTNNAVSWGLKLFPEGDDAGECSEESYPGSIAVPLAPMNAQRVNQAIDATQPKGDGTPTAEAVDEAVKYLAKVDDGSSKYILLATDGEPSCSGTGKGGDDARAAATTAVEHAAGSGIDTFVVGIATTKKSASETLTSLAKAGRRAPSSGYYLANTKDELLAALNTITAAVASCRFPLKSQPPNPTYVGVQVGSTRLSKDTAHRDGWDYVDMDYSAIELFGPACEMVKANGADTVNIVFGCKAEELF